MENINWNVMLTVVIAGSILSGVVVSAVYFLRRQDYKGLALQVEQLNANKPAQDMVETAMVKVVPIEVLQQVQQGYQAITNQIIALVSAQQDLVKAITESQKFVTTVTDGKPNAPDPAFVAGIVKEELKKVANG